jgi:hypothetical protein
VTILEARKFIILSSLGATGCVFGFLIVAKPLGYPIDWPQAVRIIEILVPVFVGYLGTASHFLFRTSNEEAEVEFGPKAGLLSLLIKGPIAVFCFILIAIFLSFGYSNRKDAPKNSGMEIDTLAWAVTACLGILTVSTSVAVNYLFSVAQAKATPDQSKPESPTAP